MAMLSIMSVYYKRASFITGCENTVFYALNHAAMTIFD